MHIYGVVSAKSARHATAILMGLINDGILEHFELDGSETLDERIINSRDAYVDNEGYLTFDEDISGDLSELIVERFHTYGFEAEYIE